MAIQATHRETRERSGQDMSVPWASGPSRRRSVGVGDGTKDRRPRLKALAAESAQERRRQEFISNQRKARRNLSDHARVLAALPSEESEVPDETAHQDGDAGEGEEDGMAVEDAFDDRLVKRDAGGPALAADGGSTADRGCAAASASATISSGLISISSRRGKQSHRGGEKGLRDARGKQDAARGGDSGSGAQPAVKRRDHWANQLCTPEWMLTVPNDLNGAGSPVGAGWYVMARPEGKRVLVVSSKGETVARQMSGAITHRFSSNLPGGSTAGRRGGGGSKGGGYCILDCVFHELDQTFFVLDMMAWKGYPLYDCNTDFRFYWVRTKLHEADGPLDAVTSTNAFRIRSTPYHECDRQGLAHAYASPVPFIKDGLLFHLKAAHYQLGPTPLVLLWKDASVSRYLGIDSAQAAVFKVGDRRAGDDGEPSEDGFGKTCSGSAQHPSTSMGSDGAPGVGLQAKGSGRSGGGHGGAVDCCRPLLTADGVCVGEVGPEGSATHVPQAKPNELLRFKMTGAGEELVDQSGSGMVDQPEEGVLRAVVEGLRFDKRCSKLRPMADTWSKVLFQARLRRNSGVRIDHIDVKCLVPAATAKAGATDETELQTVPETISSFGGDGFSYGRGKEGEDAAFSAEDDEML